MPLDNNQPVIAPGHQPPVYQKLGEDVFLFFILENSIIPFAFFLFSLVIFIVTIQPVLSETVLRETVETYGLKAGSVLLMLSIIFEAVAVFAAWLHYITYTYSLSDDALKIRKGILNKIEVSIPYRQIQNVTIERNLLFQVLGLSKLVILTAGDDESSKMVSNRDLSEGVFHAIDRKKAAAMQAELLKRASIQKVVQQNN